MTQWLVAIIMTIGAAQAAQQAAVQPLAVTALQKAIDRNDVRAAVVGLHNQGSSQVFGLGQISSRQSAAPDGQTVFEIGSISKVFTALLVQTQVEAGRLNWDDPIAQHWPLDYSSDAVAAITLRELATHTSGLPRLPDNLESPDPLDPYAGYGSDRLSAFLQGFTPETLAKEPAYSNLGAGLLGEIAARAAGQSYASAMQTHVLEPLGMHDSAVGLPERLAPRIAVGFSQGADMPNWGGFAAMAGAGAMVSTADDLLKFVRAHFADGPLSQALKTIARSQGDGAVGLGWQIRSEADEQVFWHNGGTGGYASFLAIAPSGKKAAVLLTASTEYGLVTELGMARISGVEQPPAARSLAAYEGSYKLAEGFVLSVFARDGKLFGQATGQGAFPLTPDGEHEFEFPPARIKVQFKDLESGTAGRLTMVQAGQVTEAPRVDSEQGPKTREVIDIEAATLADYAGRYQLAPGVVITVEARNDQLYVKLSGQPAYPVFPYAADQFFYRVVDAQLHFERDAEGQVDAVMLHQMGQQRAPRIER